MCGGGGEGEEEEKGKEGEGEGDDYKEQVIKAKMLFKEIQWNMIGNCVIRFFSLSECLNEFCISLFL